MNRPYVIHDFLKEDFPVSQNYGDNVEYYANFTNGALSKGHEGVDFKTPNGTEIFSPFDGIILRDTFDSKAYGNFLVVWNPVDCVALWFCHLLDYVTSVSDHVKAGQLLGHTNNTGNTSGAHCHVNFVETDTEGNRINMDNGSEGFLNLLDGQIVTYPFLPCAALVPPGTTPVTPQTVQLKAGQEIHVTTEIPVGAAPGQENFSYGKLSPDAPAMLIGAITVSGVVYYNIDQSFIGGGTGYCRADSVDSNLAVNIPAPVPQAPTENVVATSDSATVPETTTIPIAPVLPPTPTDSATAIQQRNDAIAKVKEVSDKYNEDLEHYTGIVALGYQTAKDIEKALEEVVNENFGLKKQMVDILKRNKAYHLDMAAKEEEDSTAIETGMKFESLYKSAKNELVAIAKAHKTKPTLTAILYAIDRMRTSYDLIVKQLRRQDVKQSVQQAEQSLQAVASDPVVKETASSWLERIFGFKGGGNV